MSDAGMGPEAALGIEEGIELFTLPVIGGVILDIASPR